MPRQRAPLYGKAAAGGSGAGMTAVADMMTKGDGGPKDVEGARRWLAQRAGRGDSNGLHQLANSLLHNDPKNTDVGLTMMVDAAGAGDVSAAYALGEIFKDGIDVQRDSRRALEWYHKAADAGEPKALERIGSMYDYGQGVGVDHAEARRYYDRAAAQGVGAALHDIGMQIDHGMGVRADPVAALGWYRKAAAMNVPASISNLGFAYENGRGVRKNLAEAVRWYTKAAELDDATAEHNLGSLYMDGTGVARDKLTGLSLLRKAALHGHAMSLNDLALYEMKEPRPDGARRRGHAAPRRRRQAAERLPQPCASLGRRLGRPTGLCGGELLVRPGRRGAIGPAADREVGVAVPPRREHGARARDQAGRPPRPRPDRRRRKGRQPDRARLPEGEQGGAVLPSLRP